MEVESYRSFVAIIESGSFTGAAECVHVTQPAISKQIKTLEKFFGTKLIIKERGSRKLILTEAGRILYDKAKYICSLEDLAKNEIDNVSGGVVGILRIVAANSRAALFVSAALKDFCKLHPKVTYEIYEGGIAEQAQHLLNGITELGILSVPITHEDSFEVLFRRHEELVAVFHKESAWLDETNKNITLKELAEIPLSISAGCCAILQKHCDEQAISLEILSINTTRNTTLQWVREKTAVAIVPIEPGEFLGEVFVIKKISDINIELFKTIVKVKDRPLSAIAQEFLKFYAKKRNSQQLCDFEKLKSK